ncbi:ribonuclease HII, partial [archaeon CG_4_8_14_3_um_filter_38_5]
ILAKVTRDAHIRELSKALNLDIGSGYCSDPLTKKLMKDYFNNNLSQLKPFIRHSWDTYKRGKSEKEQKGLFDCL